MFPIRRTILPLLVLFLGGLFVLIGILQNDVQMALFFVIPIIWGSGLYLTIGILLIFLSFILSLIFLFPINLNEQENSRKERVLYDEKKGKTKSRYGGIIFIGPLPIIFGKDKGMVKKLMYIGLAIAGVLLVLYLLVLYS